jgi:Phage integrase family
LAYSRLAVWCEDRDGRDLGRDPEAQRSTSGQSIQKLGEIASILPESFNWEAATVTVPACYTKNGNTATLPIPNELVDDLASYVAAMTPGRPVFPLPTEKGAKMLRRDLKAAGIPYRDNGGLVFDFHSLRCEMATLADAAGVSPRVVQKMMRHSSLELTGRYTRPRAVDIEAASSMLPSLKPEAVEADERVVMTGTDSGPVSISDATENATQANVYAFNPNVGKAVTSNVRRSHNPQVMGSSPVPGTPDKRRLQTNRSVKPLVSGGLFHWRRNIPLKPRSRH